MSRARRTRRELEDEVRRDIVELVGRALSNDKVAMRVLRAMIAAVPALLPIIFRQLPSRAQPVTRVVGRG